MGDPQAGARPPHGPEPLAARGGVVALDGTALPPPEVGGKARGLARLLARGLPVPPTWVVLPEASRAAVMTLAGMLRNAGHERMAVRSSAVGEDGAHLSFAGVHDSLLGVAPHELDAAVERIAASPCAPRVRAYRAAHGLSEAPARIAVVVQPLLEASSSGVARGGPGSGGSVHLEVVRGLGTRLQSGEARPERWVLRRTAHDEPDVAHEAGSDAPGERLLARDLVEGIARTVLRLAEEVRGDVELEWVVGSDRLWYVQWREGPRAKVDALPAGEAWTRANLGETFPEIPSALTRSLLPGISGGGVAALLRSVGLPAPASSLLCACVAGRPVLNERVYALAHVLGSGAGEVRRHVGASRPGGRPSGGPSLRKVLRHPRVAVRSAITLVRAATRARNTLDRLRSVLESMASATAGDATLERVAAELDGAPRAALEEAAAAATRLFAALVWRQQAAESLLRRHRSPAAVLARLVAAGPPSAGTRRVHALADLAARIRDRAGLSRWLALPGHERSDPRAWRETVGNEAFAHAERYALDFGHRARLESDLARPRPADDLGALHDELVPLLEASEAPMHPRSIAPGTDAWCEAFKAAGPLGRLRLRPCVARLHRLTSLREELRDRTVALLGALRARLLSAARLLADQGRLDAPSDLWDLDVATLRAAATNPAVDLRAEVARERSRLAAWRHIDVPWSFRSEDLPFEPRATGTDRSGAAPTRLRGTAAAPGLAEGTVYLLEDLDARAGLPIDAVLVASRLEPGVTPLLVRAVAVVTEIGGTLSHASIVARELGVPAVTDAADATRVLLRGERVLVDGDRGIVIRLGAPGDA